MNTTFTNTNQNVNLSPFERTLRVAFGFALIASVMTSASGFLGWTSVLALVAIYPILTGLTGADPLRSVMEGNRPAYRAAQAGLSVALIGTAFIAPIGSVGLVTLLPLFGVYSVLATLLGRSPVAALLESARTIPYVISPETGTSTASTTLRWAA